MNTIARLAIVVFLIATSSTFAQEAQNTEGTNEKKAEATNEQKYARLTKMLTKVKLVGRFTVVGKEDRPLSKEEYTINKVEKLPQGDKWMFDCRIQYGQHNVAIPLPIDVKWAEDTPIITLDDLTIPGMGTFSARVVLHEKKYAGTWRHDQVGGHLFGVIEPLDESGKAPAAKENEKDQ